MAGRTVVIPDKSRDTGDLLRNIMEMLVPILLTAVIVALILFRVDVTHKFEQTALTVQTTACVAVKESNDSNYNLWKAQIQAQPGPTDPRATKFLQALQANNAKIYTKCLEGEGTPSTRQK